MSVNTWGEHKGRGEGAKDAWVQVTRKKRWVQNFKYQKKEMGRNRWDKGDGPIVSFKNQVQGHVGTRDDKRGLGFGPKKRAGEFKNEGRDVGEGSRVDKPTKAQDRSYYEPTTSRTGQTQTGSIPVGGSKAMGIRGVECEGGVFAAMSEGPEEKGGNEEVAEAEKEEKKDAGTRGSGYGCWELVPVLTEVVRGDGTLSEEGAAGDFGESDGSLLWDSMSMESQEFRAGMEHINSIVRAVPGGVEVGEGEVEGLFCEPLAVVAPDFGDVPLLQFGEQCTQGEECKEASAWVKNKLRNFGKFLGVSFDGFEGSTLTLLGDIESRWKEEVKTGKRKVKVDGAVRKGKELKNLEWSVNYDGLEKRRGGTGRRNRALGICSK